VQGTFRTVVTGLEAGSAGPGVVFCGLEARSAEPADLQSLRSDLEAGSAGPAVVFCGLEAGSAGPVVVFCGLEAGSAGPAVVVSDLEARPVVVSSRSSRSSRENFCKISLGRRFSKNAGVRLREVADELDPTLALLEEVAGNNLELEEFELMLNLLEEDAVKELDELDPMLALLEEVAGNKTELDELGPKLLLSLLGSVAGKKPESTEVME